MNKTLRVFTCRNEELVPIAKFTSFSLKRDLNEIGQVYGNINLDYIAATDAMIAEVENLLEPQAETLAIKQVTKGLRNSMDSLLSNINILATFVKMTQKQHNNTVADFGISTLRKAINRNDAEAVIESLKIVITHAQLYSTVLQAQGMATSYLPMLEATLSDIAANRQKQYEILSNRKNIVQNNLQKLNMLYSRMVEILTIGKSIYGNDTVKRDEYTYAKLLSKVRQTAKAKKTEPEAEANADAEAIVESNTNNN